MLEQCGAPLTGRELEPSALKGLALSPVLFAQVAGRAAHRPAAGLALGHAGRVRAVGLNATPHAHGEELEER